VILCFVILNLDNILYFFIMGVLYTVMFSFIDLLCIMMITIL